MGDAVVATSLLDSLRLTFTEAQIDFVLNQRIAPLFEGHDAISNIITFTDEERKGLRYIKKVRQIVRDGRYDAIIDMRSTFNTSLFALFSRSSKFRVGIDKPYLRWIYNKRVPRCGSLSMIDHNLRFLNALMPEAVAVSKKLSLKITEEELKEMGERMASAGIDVGKPVMLACVTTKLIHKEWPRKDMAEVLSFYLQKYPGAQIVMNYAPGDEEKRALEVREMITVGRERVFMEPRAKSMRQLAALCANSTFFFGNEGGARHIAQAMGIPTLAICSKGISSHTWIPVYDGTSEGIEGRVENRGDEEVYCPPGVDEVKEKLELFCQKFSV